VAVSAENRLRYRSMRISREVKWLLMAVPGRFQERLRARLWRWLFLSDAGKIHRAGEVLLADLRDFAAVGLPIFDPDPAIMARRLGRREVVERIINYLNLDEATVQQLMQLDDGLGD
jgi:hypothetical protein